FCGNNTSSVKGVFHVATINGITFIQPLFFIIKNDKIFCTIEGSWDSDSHIEFIIFEKVFKIGFEQNTQRWIAVVVLAGGITIQASEKQAVVQLGGYVVCPEF